MDNIQVEEAFSEVDWAEMFHAEDADTFWNGSVTTATIWNNDGTSLITINFPNPTMAFEWMKGIKLDD